MYYFTQLVPIYIDPFTMSGTRVGWDTWQWSLCCTGSAPSEDQWGVSCVEIMSVEIPHYPEIQNIKNISQTNLFTVILEYIPVHRFLHNSITKFHSCLTLHTFLKHSSRPMASSSWADIRLTSSVSVSTICGVVSEGSMEKLIIPDKFSERVTPLLTTTV